MSEDECVCSFKEKVRVKRERLNHVVVSRTASACTPSTLINMMPGPHRISTSLCCHENTFYCTALASSSPCKQAHCVDSACTCHRHCDVERGCQQCERCSTLSIDTYSRQHINSTILHQPLSLQVQVRPPIIHIPLLIFKLLLHVWIPVPSVPVLQGLPQCQRLLYLRHLKERLG